MRKIKHLSKNLLRRKKYHKEILKLDPENQIAKKRLKEIEEFYYNTGIEYLNKGNIKRAEVFIDRLSKVNEESEYIVNI